MVAQVVLQLTKDEVAVTYKDHQISTCMYSSEIFKYSYQSTHLKLYPSYFCPCISISNYLNLLCLTKIVRLARLAFMNCLLTKCCS